MILRKDKLLDEETYRFIRLKETYRKLEADEKDYIISFVSYIKNKGYYNGKLSNLITSMNRYIIENDNPIPLLAISKSTMISALKKMEDILQELDIIVSITKIKYINTFGYNIEAKIDRLVNSSNNE